MSRKKIVEEQSIIKLENTDSVKAIIADTLTKKNNSLKEIRLLNENIKYLEEKLNSVFVAYAEGKGYELKDYNIIEYCDHGRYIVVEKKANNG